MGFQYKWMKVFITRWGECSHQNVFTINKLSEAKIKGCIIKIGRVGRELYPGSWRRSGDRNEKRPQGLKLTLYLIPHFEVKCILTSPWDSRILHVRIWNIYYACVYELTCRYAECKVVLPTDHLSLPTLHINRKTPMATLRLLILVRIKNTYYSISDKYICSLGGIVRYKVYFSDVHKLSEHVLWYSLSRHQLLCSFALQITEWNKKINSVAWIREQTIPTMSTPLVREVGANFFWIEVPHNLGFLDHHLAVTRKFQ
jgi:hypothetical protein